jgi:hypothetical protein
MEELEDRLAPVSEPLVIDVRFVAADKSIVGGFQTIVHHEPGQTKKSRPASRGYR